MPGLVLNEIILLSFNYDQFYHSHIAGVQITLIRLYMVPKLVMEKSGFKLVLTLLWGTISYHYSLLPQLMF